MAHHKLRAEKNCLNCGFYVAERFCPKCGQENSINRPPFHYLFTHFIEDLTHYDSGFWKTIRFLITKPGFVINEYLAGKRKSYVPPVKLYIFISFITFLLPYILPSCNNHGQNTKNNEFIKIDIDSTDEGIDVAGFKNIKTVKTLDSIQSILPANKKIDKIEYKILQKTLENYEAQSNRSNFKGYSFNGHTGIKTTAQLDSIYSAIKNPPLSKRLNYKLVRQSIVMSSKENAGEMFSENFLHNLPKVMFIYLPIFAFLLWLFHDRKKWRYYDHGVFTLYYFSTVFLLIIILILINWILSFFQFFSALDIIFQLSVFIALLYAMFNFFRSHHKVYNEKRSVSRWKSIWLFLISSLIVTVLLAIYLVYVYFNVH